MPLPSLDQVRSLPAYFEMAVPDDYIDVNGHMNVSRYFELGVWAPWKRITELGVDEAYIDGGLSYFTVEHHIRYLAELRLGDTISVRPAFVERSGKVLRGISFVVDEARDRIACTLELLYVHVSTETRRATDVPEHVSSALDIEIARHPWALEAATGIALRR